MKPSVALVDQSSFSCLPDEIVLQVLAKLIDLDALCRCKLVSRRFKYLVNQVDAISFTARIVEPSYHCESFRSAMKSMRMFKQLKSLCIQLPASSESVDHNGYLFQWRVNFRDRVNAFAFLSPDAIYDKNGICVDGNDQEQEEGMRINFTKVQIAYYCLEDVRKRVRLLSDHIVSFPMLETVSITRSGIKGTVSLSGAKLVEVRNLLKSLYDSNKQIGRVCSPDQMSWGYVPLLELPVSGYVMKGVTLVLFERSFTDEDDSFTNDGFEDKEDVAYSEAVMEILHKHWDAVKRLD